MFQGHDGVDIEMNLNDNRSRLDDDEFHDMVFYTAIYIYCYNWTQHLLVY